MVDMVGMLAVVVEIESFMQRTDIPLDRESMPKKAELLLMASMKTETPLTVLVQ